MISLLIALLLSPVLLAGILWIVVGIRFKKNAVKSGGDPSSFWSNWVVFTWAWAEQADEIVEKLPHFKHDLTENFDYRPKDGKT